MRSSALPLWLGMALILVAAFALQAEGKFPGFDPCTKDSKVGDSCYMAPLDFRPTQFMIGYDLVYYETLLIDGYSVDELEKFLRKEQIPVVIGPKNDYYMTDHHHHCRAMYEADIKAEYKVMVANITHDWSDLSLDEFWPQMLASGFYWPYDPQGSGPLDPYYLPHKVDEVPDDPYRSLVGNLLEVGAISKTTVPYAEFMWANYFRERINILNWTRPSCHPTSITPERLKDMSWCCVRPADPSCFPDKDHKATLQFVPAAIPLAHSPAAKNLPGYIPDSPAIARP